MNRNKLLVVLLVVLGLSSVQAQNKLDYTEFNLSVGTLNYSGDIATENNVSNFITDMGPNVRVSAKRHFNDWFGMGAEMGYGYFTADDNTHGNPNRGLSVTTSVFQASVFAEVHFIRFGKYHIEDKFSPYLKFGGGFNAWNPDLSTSRVYPEKYDIQSDAYSSASFLGGLGAKFRASKKSVITLEWVKSFPGADNLDGFINPDAANDNDTYSSFYLGYSFLIL